jgi:hypothetical protein
MPQIVATIHDRMDFCSFKLNLEAAKACMLEAYAKEKGIETDLEWAEHWRYIVAKCKDGNEVYELLHILEVRGCWGLHVWASEEDLSFYETVFGNRFLYCKGEFAP